MGISGYFIPRTYRWRTPWGIIWGLVKSLSSLRAGDGYHRSPRQGFLQDFWYPDVSAGLMGMCWVAQCVKSADAGAVRVACWNGCLAGKRGTRPLLS